MKPTLLLVATVLVQGWTALAFAQGVQSGSLRGTVIDQRGLAVPGVSVIVMSIALQGARRTTTDPQGRFVLRQLPPGDYDVTYALMGAAPLTRKTRIDLGGSVEQRVALRGVGIAETVAVVGETASPLAAGAGGANFKKAEIDRLPTPRTLQGAAQLAPGVTGNAPDAGQLVIHGAFASDNVFLINGVDINDNLFAAAQTLFIEEAIEETQVLTAGIPAEYGRFGGGVVNAVTKSGGNVFSGGARITVLNPQWTTATPFEVARGIDAHPDVLSRVYEGTFGGPIAKDRLWFFLSGEYGAVAGTRTLPQTGLVLPTTDTNRRGELKLTGTVASNQQLQGGYQTNGRVLVHDSALQNFVIDPHSEVDRTVPNFYYFGNYHAAARNRLLVDVRMSARRSEFGQTPSPVPGLTGSPFIALSCQCLYNAPYLDADDPEGRNNLQFAGAVTRDWGKSARHETKIGYEFLRSQRVGGGGRSPSGYVFNADFLTNAAGVPVLDPTGRPIPVFVPGDTYVEFFQAVKGAALNVDTHSLFVQDHWAAGSRWSADLGARVEKVTAISTGGIRGVDAGRIVPRLAATYDAGGGRRVFHASYGQYSSRYNEAQIGANSPVGTPAYFAPTYQGPRGQGYGFTPGFTLANYPMTAANAVVRVPLANVSMDPSLKSPLTHEFSVSYGVNLNRGRGYTEAAYVLRKTNSLVEAFTTRPDGTTRVVANGIDAGVVSNVVYRNSDDAHRNYEAMVFQTRYRISDRWNVTGHYTLQTKNDGNYEGEGTNTPGATSAIGTYPEAYPRARFYPDGQLQDFQRHRLRLWSTYLWDMGRGGDLSVSGLWRVDSPRVYSLVVRNVSPTSAQRTILRNAGYPDVPGPTNVFFGARGSEEFAGSGVVDVALTYGVPLIRSLRPWLKVEVYNLLDNQKLIAWNTTIAPDPSTPLDAFGLRTGFVKSAAFGTATGNTVTNGNLTGIDAYPVAVSGAPHGGRTFRVALGFRM